jgi:hypothetical protein
MSSHTPKKASYGAFFVHPKVMFNAFDCMPRYRTNIKKAFTFLVKAFPINCDRVRIQT